MSTTTLSQTVDTWTLRAVAASRHLARLYRTLGDGKQASHALQAGSPAEERAQRLGLLAQLPAAEARLKDDVSEETEQEAWAWQSLIESQAGICAFHAMVLDHQDSRGLRGSRTAASRAFQLALKGYRIAFPEPLTSIGIGQAIEAAADGCVRAFVEDLPEQSDEACNSEAIREIHRSISEALRAAAEHPEA